MLNKIQIIGRLGNDPDVRYSQSGSALTTISVATTETWKDKEGNKQERTEWHRVKFFGKLAEIAGEYLKKGALVYVEGSIRTEKYTDKEGVEKYSTDIIANEMKMLGSKGDSAGEEGGAPQRSASGARPAGNGSGGGSTGRGGSRPPVAGPGARGGKPPAPMSNDPHPDDDIPFD